MTRFSVVIPANNEEHTIRRLLNALGELAGEAEVCVVCNGCSDATAAVVRTTAGWVRVVELAEGSKPAALRMGDRSVVGMPRLYLDADVVLTADAIRALAEALIRGDLEAVAPTPRYHTDAANPLIRSHLRLWSSLHSTTNALYGTGAMMVTADGRSRFGEWPDVIADDYFLDGLFDPVEKRRLPDVEIMVTLPRSFREFVSRKARVHQGNRDLLRAGLRSQGMSQDGPAVLLVGLLRERPSLVVHLPAHLLVTVSARLLSGWRRWRRTASTFYRDTSTR